MDSRFRGDLGLLAAALSMAALGGIIAGASTGEWRMPLMEVLRAILQGPPSREGLGSPFVVWYLRLPRTLGALLSGAALGFAGVIFQSVFRNRLAEPYTLGVASGAAFGAAAAILLGMSPSGGALLGSFASLVAVLSLSLGAGPSGMIMSGVVISSVLGAGLTLLKALAGEKVSAIVLWLMGSFSGATWYGVLLALLGALSGLLTSMGLRKELDLLASGADLSSLGARERLVRVLALIGASCAAALVVGQFGVIGFVGLVAPHMIRLVLGPSSLGLSICSALLGGVLLVWADVMCRMLDEMPVGVVTSLMGGPVFLWLVWRGRGDA
ncbi:MAG: iron ABC transporter permease [Thermanaerothrix sp.]|nr:iron ABC transporter permease [Thermanaerothrix sp.]